MKVGFIGIDCEYLDDLHFMCEDSELTPIETIEDIMKNDIYSDEPEDYVKWFEKIYELVQCLQDGDDVYADADLSWLCYSRPNGVKYDADTIEYVPEYEFLDYGLNTDMDSRIYNVTDSYIKRNSKSFDKIYK
jgi:hypothetical protein